MGNSKSSAAARKFERLLATTPKAADPIGALSIVLSQLLTYSDRYEISIQFWGEDNTNVFIEKGGVDLWSNGGLSPYKAMFEAVQYLNKINGKTSLI